jgi:hypothetical protein
VGEKSEISSLTPKVSLSYHTWERRVWGEKGIVSALQEPHCGGTFGVTTHLGLLVEFQFMPAVPHPLVESAGLHY